MRLSSHSSVVAISGAASTSRHSLRYVVAFACFPGRCGLSLPTVDITQPATEHMWLPSAVTALMDSPIPKDYSKGLPLRLGHKLRCRHMPRQEVFQGISLVCLSALSRCPRADFLLLRSNDHFSPLLPVLPRSVKQHDACHSSC
jgi:hypothetical protein